MFTSLLLVAFFAPLPNADAAEQKALAALEAVGFRAKVSDDKSRQVVELKFTHVKGPMGKYLAPTEKDLANLADLRNLVKLDLPSRPTNDATLDAIRSPVLRELHLQSSGVTTDGLKKLAKFKKLTFLDLNGVAVTDEGLKVLASFSALKDIGLNNAKVTDRGLKALENSGITYLTLRYTGVGDDGIASLAKMPDLEVLGLTQTKVTDKGLAAMAVAGTFLKVTALGLEGTDVSDEGLKALHDPAMLPLLKVLDVSETRVTRAGVEAFRKARPKVEVVNLGSK
jgi:Leucine-rich repeat (LRR) protein